jgi:hypothetical protein
MDSACENGTRCDGTGEALWKLGLLLLVIELVLILLFAALSAGGTEVEAKQD